MDGFALTSARPLEERQLPVLDQLATKHASASMPCGLSVSRCELHVHLSDLMIRFAVRQHNARLDIVPHGTLVCN